MPVRIEALANEPLDLVGVCIELRITFLISKKNSSLVAKDEIINTAGKSVSSENVISRKFVNRRSEASGFIFGS